jgi:hypothetical protein
MSALRGGTPALKQLRRAGRYAKMANLPPAISQAPEGLERLYQMVALWPKIGRPQSTFLRAI